MPNYLLEIGCEEIPARFINRVVTDLKEKVEQMIKKQDLSFDSIETFSTYRRLTLIVKNVADKQNDKDLEVKGPPVDIACDDKGNYLPPAIGFAKKCGVDVSELKQKDFGPKRCLTVKQFLKGKTVQELFPELIQEAVYTLPLPIAMKWGTQTRAFIRPVHWVVSMLDADVLPLTLFDVEADNKTYGHRIHTQHKDEKWLIRGKQLTLKNALTYESQLEKESVIVDPVKRRQIIESDCKKNKAQQDKELLNEVTNLCEYPVPLVGDIQKEFLSLPVEVVIQSMKSHQKYFPVLNTNGQLEAKFVVVADNVTKENAQSVIKNNERVLTARLNDAQFFWAEDLKQPLSKNIDKLKGIIYQKDCGTMFDKKDRIKRLAIFLNQIIPKLQENQVEIEQAADLCKADLVTNLVGEFPKLQGKLGALYADQEGVSSQVCSAIREHYMPIQSGAALPSTGLGVVLGLADRIDAVVCSFLTGKLPTGSQDPMGVRRAIYSILSLSFEFKFDYNFMEAFEKGYIILGKSKTNLKELESFFMQRVRQFLIDQGLSYDVVEAALGGRYEGLFKAYESAKAMVDYKQNNPIMFKRLVDNAVRVKRLSEKAEDVEEYVDPQLFEVPEEKLAFDTFQHIYSEIHEEIDTRHVSDVVPSLSDLSEPIEAYFDSVMVMSENIEVQQNRLSFLTQLNTLYSQLADFEKIVI